MSDNVSTLTVSLYLKCCDSSKWRGSVGTSKDFGWIRAQVLDRRIGRGYRGIRDFGCVMGYNFSCIMGYGRCSCQCVIRLLYRGLRSRREIPWSWYLQISACQKGNIQMTRTCNVTKATGIILKKKEVFVKESSNTEGEWTYQVAAHITPFPLS